MAALFDIAARTLVVVGEWSAFPARRVYYVGRNYLDHILD